MSRFTTTVVATFAALILAAPAVSKEPKTNSKGERLYCKSMTFTGSRVSKEVCRTEKEWENMLDPADFVRLKQKQSAATTQTGSN